MKIFDPIRYVICVEIDKEFNYITAENFLYHITGCKFQRDNSIWHMDERFIDSEDGKQFGEFIRNNITCGENNTPYIYKDNRIFLFFKSFPVNEVVDMLSNRAKKFMGGKINIISVTLVRYQTNEHLIYKVG